MADFNDDQFDEMIRNANIRHPYGRIQRRVEENVFNKRLEAYKDMPMSEVGADTLGAERDYADRMSHTMIQMAFSPEPELRQMGREFIGQHVFRRKNQ